VHGWQTNRPDRMESAGVLAFLMLAVLVVTRVKDEDGATTTWPTLLWLAQGETACHDQIALLWRASLTSNVLNRAARDVLSNWAETVEGHDRPAEALVRLLQAGATDHRPAAIVRRLATDWAKPDGRAPTLGARLLRIFPPPPQNP
jgi:hypothetical protein